MKNKRTGAEGDFLEIEISPNVFVYARKLRSPSVALYDGLFTGHCTDINCISSKDSLIKLCVFDYAIAKKRWKIIGNRPLENALQKDVEFWKKKFRVVSDEDFKQGVDPGFDYYITDGEKLLCLASDAARRGLAKDAVYTPEYIEECLRDHYGMDEQGNRKLPIHLYDALLKEV